MDFMVWVPVSSTGKVSDGCIRDLRFNLRLYQKLINVLFRNGRHRLKLFQHMLSYVTNIFYVCILYICAHFFFFKFRTLILIFKLGPYRTKIFKLVPRNCVVSLLNLLLLIGFLDIIKSSLFLLLLLSIMQNKVVKHMRSAHMSRFVLVF